MFAIRKSSPSGTAHAAADVNWSQKAHYSKNTVDNLVIAGLVDFDLGRSKRSKTEGARKDSGTKQWRPASQNPVLYWL